MDTATTGTVADEASFAAGDWIIPALLTLLVLVVTTVALFVYRRVAVSGNTVVIIGLNDSGKSVLYTKLINPKLKWSTYTSMSENVYEAYLSPKGHQYRLIDFPGSERMRRQLYSKWLAKGSAIRCIVFVVDSATFGKKAKDVAELAYDVIYECNKRIPLLIACNKQDINIAKTSKVIRDTLEKEFGLINLSREAALSSTSGDEKRVLTASGKDFRWSELKCRVDFVECCAEENDQFNLEPVRDWIDTI
ncbi:Signal recognition particle receptor [Aphelenchoides avenae]|nr:Signal recognition particle receptor [Aphelenchus avenae]